MRHTQIDGIHFTHLDWSDMDQLTRHLAEEVIMSERKFDRIIAVANGGLTMARHLGDQIGLKKISVLQTAFYAGIGETHPKPQILQPLAVDVHNEHLLVFEDIVDTGATIQFITPHLLQDHKAASVSVASLVSKSWAAVQPDFVAEQLDTWVIYPYETRETIRSLSEKWSSKGVDEDALWLRFQEIGFADTDIGRFLK